MFEGWSLAIPFFCGARTRQLCLSMKPKSMSRPATAATVASASGGRSSSPRAARTAATAATAATSTSWPTRTRTRCSTSPAGTTGRRRTASPAKGATSPGLAGRDLVIPVPPGTLIYDTDLDLLIKDLNELGMKVLICRGGKGGKGNRPSRPPRTRRPASSSPAEPGQERNLRLELKLIADVGLVGMPNAGKSTLLSRSSAARPKIAPYPFTTLEPVLGIVELPGFRRFVMADIPGLIEGASQGAGLGHDFLRHIERTRILVHILDIMPLDGSDPVDNYHAIRKELAQHSRILAEKDEVVVANKIDLDPDGIRLKDLQERLDRKIVPISAATGQGIRELSRTALAEGPGAGRRGIVPTAWNAVLSVRGVRGNAQAGAVDSPSDPR